MRAGSVTVYKCLYDVYRKVGNCKAFLYDIKILLFYIFMARISMHMNFFIGMSG